MFLLKRSIMTALLAGLTSVGWGQIVDLAAQPSSIPAGVGALTLVTCRITDTNVLGESVLLQRIDANGLVTGTLGNLRDTGLNGDATAGDGIFSNRFGINESTPGILRLRVSAGLRGSIRRILSPIVQMTITGTATSVRILSPARDAYLSLGPVVVRGMIGDASLNVSVNGIVATRSGTEFSASVPLIEGTNTLTAVATSGVGGSSSDSLQVVLDTTAPRVTVGSPTEGFRTTIATVNVSGIVNDIVVGTVNPLQASVTVNGIAAVVANRTFTSANVPLNLGANTIRAEARDRAGNSFVQSITVFRDAPTPNAPTLVLISGNNQTGGINSPVPAPLIVQANSATGQPVPLVAVTFRVSENNGLVNALPAVVINTDAQGRAQVTFQLGSRSGAGANRVEAFSGGYEGLAIFSASATPAGPARIIVDSGLNQTGATGRALPFPFVAVVTDGGNNRLSNVPVSFAVRSGGGNINNQVSFATTSDSDGRVMATLTMGLEEGVSNNVVEANFTGNAGQGAVFTATALTPGPISSTAISGVVQDNSNVPLPGVTIRLFQLAQGAANGQPQQISTPVVTDATGAFRIANAPVGTMKLMADGSTAQPNGGWPTLEFDLTTVAGRNNTVGTPIYLPQLDQINRLCVNATIGGTLTLPNVPGFSLTVAPGSATFPGGSRTGCISVTPVNPDKVPMVPGFGQQPRFVVTIQPVGTMFNPPAQIVIPNVDGLAPREKTEMYSFDHDLASFVAIGSGTTSNDGSVIASDPGVGVIKAGWHCGGNPNPTGSAGTCPTCQKCQGTNCISDNTQQPPQDCKECRGGAPVPSSDGTNPRDTISCCFNGDRLNKLGQTVGLFSPGTLETKCPLRTTNRALQNEIDGCSNPISPTIKDDPMQLFASVYPFGLFNQAPTLFGQDLRATPGAPTGSLPCNQHDICYQTCAPRGTSMSDAQLACDDGMKNRTDNVCTAAYPSSCPAGLGVLECGSYFLQRLDCFTYSTAYYGVLRAAGFVAAYQGRQEEYCKCCP